MSKHNNIIKESNLRYKCNFCGKLFISCSACARHIEKESFAGICFPADIKIVDLNEIDIRENES